MHPHHVARHTLEAEAADAALHIAVARARLARGLAVDPQPLQAAVHRICACADAIAAEASPRLRAQLAMLASEYDALTAETEDATGFAPDAATPRRRAAGGR